MSMQCTSSYSRSESPSVAESTAAATASRSDIHDVRDNVNDDSRYAYSVTASSTVTLTGTDQIGSRLRC